VKVKTRLRAGCDCDDGCIRCSDWMELLKCDSKCRFWAPPQIEWEALAW
jgi:hypothetical protein